MNRLSIARTGLFAVVAPLAASAAHADTERYGLTSFDRIEVQGDMVVEVASDYRIGASAEGSRDALETLSVEVIDRTLTISHRLEGPYGQPRRDAGPVTVRVRAQNLAAVTLRGAGAMQVSGLRGARAQVLLNGAGTITIDRIAADDLTVATAGTGNVTLAGRTRTLNANIGGSSSVNAPDLAAQILRVRAVGSGSSRFAATTAAEVVALGTASLAVSGRARCTVRNAGSGTVTCGSAAAAR